MDTINPERADTGTLLPAKKVQQRYDVSDRTIDRWLASKTLGFPQPVLINKRRYWRISELVVWERSHVRGGLRDAQAQDRENRGRTAPPCAQS
jgi:hypothetical protein